LNALRVLIKFLLPEEGKFFDYLDGAAKADDAAARRWC